MGAADRGLYSDRKGECISVLPFLYWAKSTQREGQKTFPRNDEIWQPQIVKHPQLVWKWHALFLHKANCFCQSLELLYHFWVCLFWWLFIYPCCMCVVVNHKYSPIWRQCTTWCFPRPFQSGVTTAVRGVLKKCQLAIKVPQTSIMSSSYESPGAAQNGAIMSTVKNGCGRPQHSLFPSINDSSVLALESLPACGGAQAAAGVSVSNHGSSHRIHGVGMCTKPSICIPCGRASPSVELGLELSGWSFSLWVTLSQLSKHGPLTSCSCLTITLRATLTLRRN